MLPPDPPTMYYKIRRSINKYPSNIRIYLRGIRGFMKMNITSNGIFFIK
nr:MAG TPA: hypothetical protein [Caudoviricetes sp.]